MLASAMQESLAAFGSRTFRTNCLQLSIFYVLWAIQILCHLFFLFSTKFGLYANLSARMQWSRNQKRLRTISPAAGMVVATQPAVGATLVLRPPGKEPWKALRAHKEPLGVGKGVSILQHPVWNSYAGIWMITKNIWDGETIGSLWNYLGIWYTNVFFICFSCFVGISKQRKHPTLISDAFFSAVHRFANALLAIGAGGWNEEGRVGSVVGLWAMGKWCTKVREWTNCGQLAQ